MTSDEPDRAAREPSAVEKRLVLVVHGMGDEDAGSTLRSFARSIAVTSGRVQSPTEEVLWLPQGSGRQVEMFPCQVERLADGPAETILAEVYWADLSKLRGGFLSTLLGFCRLIFGLHEVVARHAADPHRSQRRTADPAAEFLQKLSLVIAYVLRGPAVAAMTLFALGWAIGAGLGLLELPVGFGAWAKAMYVAIGLIGLAVGAWGFRKRRGSSSSALFLWLAIFGLTSLASAPFADLMTWSRESAAGESWVLGLEQSQYPTALAQWLIPLAAVAWLAARLRAQRVYRPGLDLAQALNFVTFGAWVLLVQVLLIVVSEYIPEKIIPVQAVATMDLIASGMAFNWVVVALVAGVALMTFWVYLRWTGRNRAETYQPSRAAPRLVLGWPVVASAIALPLLLLGLFFLPPGLSQRLAAVLNRAADLVVPVAFLLWSVALTTSERLRFVVDFGLDIVGHFERRRSGAGERPDFVRRKRIRERFQIVLGALVRRERPGQLTVLAHSYGTVVAIEALAEDSAGTLLQPLARCDLVTMGSPFHHLLQHYFPNDYPRLCHQRWDGLRHRANRWINIFRIDDYVGTDIEPDGEWPENCPVDPGGHTGYWSDRQVLRILDDRQLV